MAKKTTSKSTKKPARLGADKIAADAKTARLRKQALDTINARIEGANDAPKAGRKRKATADQGGTPDAARDLSDAERAAVSVFGAEVLKPAPDLSSGTPARKRHVGPGGKRIAAPKTPKAAKAPKAPREKKPKRVSALDAAAQVLAASEVPLRAKDMISQMEAKGLWQSPGGKTPEATLYAAIIREISAKGDKARFKKHERGVFVATRHASTKEA